MALPAGVGEVTAEAALPPAEEYAEVGRLGLHGARVHDLAGGSVDHAQVHGEVRFPSPLLREKIEQRR